MSSGEPHAELAADRKQTRRTMLRTTGAVAVGALGIGGGLVGRSSAKLAPQRPLSPVDTPASTPVRVGPAIDESSLEVTESGTGLLERYAIEIRGAIDTASVPSEATPDRVIAQAMGAGDRLEIKRTPIGITRTDTFGGELSSTSKWVGFGSVQVWIRYEEASLNLPDL